MANSNALEIQAYNSIAYEAQEGAQDAYRVVHARHVVMDLTTVAGFVAVAEMPDTFGKAALAVGSIALVGYNLLKGHKDYKRAAALDIKCSEFEALANGRVDPRVKPPADFNW